MAQRRCGGKHLEIALLVEDEAPVRDVEQAREHVVAHSVALPRHDREMRVRRDEGQHQQEGREQPSGPARPERGEPELRRAPELEHEQRRDQEAREHEEGVDAEEPALHPRVVVVVCDDREDRDRAETVECGVIAEPRCGRAGFESSRGDRPV